MVLLIFTLLTYLKGIADKAIQKKEIDLKKEEMDLKNYTNPVNENKQRIELPCGELILLPAKPYKLPKYKHIKQQPYNVYINLRHW